MTVIDNEVVYIYPKDKYFTVYLRPRDYKQINKDVFYMYKELNSNIETCEFEGSSADNEWNEVACDFAGDCLDAFTEEDWKVLFQELPNKTTLWKKRFNDLLINPEDPNQQKALLFLAGTDDLDLFVRVLENLSELEDIHEVEGYDQLCEKAIKILPDLDVIHQMRVNDFLKKER